MSAKTSKSLKKAGAPNQGFSIAIKDTAVELINDELKTVKLEAGKSRDSWEEEYYYDGKTSGNLLTDFLVNYIHQVWMPKVDIRVVKAKVRIGVYAREALTIIPPQPEGTDIRLVFNLNHDDLYHFRTEGTAEIDSPIFKPTDYSVGVKANHMLILPPPEVSAHQIMVKRATRFSFPQNEFWKWINGGKGRPSTIRPNSYRRVTITVDISSDDQTHQELRDLFVNSSKFIETMKSQGEVDISPKELMKQVKG